MKLAKHSMFVCVIASFFAPLVVGESRAADVPADRVVVIYFHRTQRCPTCRKMGGYSKEAVGTGFAQQIKEGKVEFHFIDFQDEKNAALTKAYKVSGSSLVVAKVAGGKIAEYKSLKEIWAKVGDEAAFIEYVQSNIRGYLK